MQQPSLFDSATASSSRTDSSEDQQRQIRFLPDFKHFRIAAKSAIAQGLRPDQIWWIEQSHYSSGGEVEPIKQRLSDPVANSPSSTNAEFKVPREFLSLAKFAACHRAPDRWSLLYQILWQLTHGEPYLLSLAGDPLVAQLHRYDKAVHRDLHKMKAFVRFKKLDLENNSDSSESHYVAWFESEHHIIELAADFFVRRFTQYELVGINATRMRPLARLRPDHFH